MMTDKELGALVRTHTMGGVARQIAREVICQDARTNDPVTVAFKDGLEYAMAILLSDTSSPASERQVKQYIATIRAELGY